MNRRSLGCLLELLETLLVVLVIFLVVQLFVAQPYQIQQTSMENTLMPGQYVLVDKLTPHFDDYHRDDIVVFKPPAGWEDPSGTAYVKRVIGVAGDTIDIHGGHAYLNGTLLVEPFVMKGQTTDMQDGRSRTWALKKDELFVMGDHREQSQDSRDFGPIPKSSVIGRAWLRYWPTSAFGLVPQAKPQPSPSVSPAPSKIP